MVALWFTPTRVGTATSCRSGGKQGAVHPHASGDSELKHAVGTPTPTRVGTAIRRVARTSQYRFTPTRVGTARSMARHGRRGLNGSPPREWGQPSWSSLAVSPPREWGQPSWAASPRDGDRARGPFGSPPREWGQRAKGGGVPPRMGTQDVTPSQRRSRGSPPREWGQPPSTCRPPGGNQVHPHASGDSP